jgi:cell wall-associated NlpC family hydrolase
MSTGAPDPRRHAYRDDLAAAALEGIVAAPRYTQGARAQVVAPAAPVRQHPRFDARLDTEALHGETVTVFDEREGWSWVQLERDGYVGYAPSEALSRGIRAATHRVAVLATHVYAAPDKKTPPQALLSLNSRVAVTEEARPPEIFARLETGGFVFQGHIVPLGETEKDFVSVAERFVGAPYLWGGRTSLGIDCSGLVQVALEAAGHAAPRDSDMQEAEVGRAMAGTRDLSVLERGDLVFWEGHLGVMVDGARLLHATAHGMQTLIEPLAGAVERIAKLRGPVTAIKRLE